MSNAKYLAFDTPNIKKPLSSSVVDAKIFGMSEQYALKYESVWTEMLSPCHLLDLMPISIAVFFGSDLIPGSAGGGLRW